MVFNELGTKCTLQVTFPYDIGYSNNTTQQSTPHKPGGEFLMNKPKPSPWHQTQLQPGKGY